MILYFRPAPHDRSRTLRLERCNPAKRMLRFYALPVTPDRFGEWCLLRAWGPIGRQGQMRTEWFETKEEAVREIQALERVKRKRGYRQARVLL